jgi:hypothetical protein
MNIEQRQLYRAGMAFALAILSSTSLSACAKQDDNPDSASKEQASQVKAESKKLVITAVENDMAAKEIKPVKNALDLEKKSDSGTDVKKMTADYPLSGSLSRPWGSEHTAAKQPLFYQMRFTVTNTQSHSIDMQFNSGMTADLLLINSEGDTIWHWASDRMFTQAIRQVRLASGETIDVDFQVPSKVLEQVKGDNYLWRAELKAKPMDDSDTDLMAPVELKH